MVELLLLALALAADAFAVSLVRGSVGEHRLLRALEVGLAFGAAQGLMPLIGWALGMLFAEAIEAVDHWIAFGLLSILGLKMIREAWLDEPEELVPSRSGFWLGLLAAALATSIDAAAAGLTLDLFAPPVWLCCLVIGVVTALLSTAGYWFASRVGERLGRWAEAGGGLVLIALGVRILVEHLGLGAG